MTNKNGKYCASIHSKKFEDGIYYRDAELETNPEIKFRLADIPLPNGILRVDKVSFPLTTELRYGHYSLPELESHIVTKEQKAGGYTAYCMDNGAYRNSAYQSPGLVGSGICTD